MHIIIVFATPDKKESFVNTLPNPGMLYLASYLETKNHHVDVIDGNVQNIKAKWSKYDCFCFSLNISNIKNTYKIIKKLKQLYPQKKIILGGPSTPQTAKEYLKNSKADIAIYGEGEQTLHEFIQKKDIQNIKGLCYKKNNNIITNPARKKRTNLNTLPFPALNKVPLEKYHIPMSKAQPISIIMTSLGCPMGCIFCFHDKLWRPRKPQNVVKEIKWQVNELGVKEIVIYDDNFTYDQKRAEQICDLIIKNNIKVHLQFQNGIRADMVNEKLIKKMKQAGVWLIGVAPETGSKKTNKRINKKMDNKKVEQTIAWCKKYNIVTYGFFMLGFPWETKKNIEKTIAYAKKLDCDFNQFSVVTPIQGTPLYNMLEYVPQNNTFFGGELNNLTNIPNKDFNKLIKKAYRAVYLKPKKMFKILTILPPRKILALAIYAIKQKSI